MTSTAVRPTAALASVLEAKRGGRFTHAEDVWSTTVVLEIDAPQLTVHELFAARDAVVAFVHHVDEVFSTFKAHSLVSQFREGRLSEEDLQALADRGNRGAGELVDVIRRCRRALLDTRGSFDAWAAPGGFDPSGLVKGWAADMALAILREHGVRRAFVNCGGDAAAMSDAGPWVTGITDPDDNTKLVKTLALSGGSIATSGTYERGDHVVDPKLGGRGSGARSATVIGPDSALADAYATALCVDGVSGIEWFHALGEGWSLFMVPVDGRTAYRYGPAFA
jgi:thiamine biosynthesis lipoprotein